MTCESKTKPSCDWSDPDARSELINGLVTDGLALIEAVEGVKLDPEQADAVGLLGVVTGQDVEPDPHRVGRWRIAQRVAKDRTISTVDPEARHGHKTRTHKRDGYKAHVAVEPVTGLVTAAVLTAANTPDADSIAGLVADQPPGAEIVADSAYASGAALETFDDLGHTPVVKPIVGKPHIEDGFHRDDFCIDTGARTVTCPANHTTRIRPGGTAPFAKRCNGCPLRARCTTSQKGRTITVDKHHDRRAREQTTVGQRRNAGHLPELAAVRRTDHRLAHPRESQTRSLPRNHPQPAMAHHPNSSHQPTTPHQPRTHPHHHRLGHQPRLEPQNPPAPKEPRHRHQPDPKHPPHKPQPAPPHQHSQLAEPDNQQAPSVLSRGFVVDSW